MYLLPRCTGLGCTAVCADHALCIWYMMIYTMQADVEQAGREAAARAPKVITEITLKNGSVMQARFLLYIYLLMNAAKDAKMQGQGRVVPGRGRGPRLVVWKTPVRPQRGTWCVGRWWFDGRTNLGLAATPSEVTVKFSRTHSLTL